MTIKFGLLVGATAFVASIWFVENSLFDNWCSILVIYEKWLKLSTFFPSAWNLCIIRDLVTEPNKRILRQYK